MSIKIITGGLIFILMIGGCARIQSQAMPDTKITNFKTAYIEPMPQDEFNLTPAVAWELADMGLKVKLQTPSADALDTDLLVKLSYVGGWDIQRYLRGFNVQMLSAKDRTLIASVSYFKLGIFITQASRMEDAFNDLREKLQLQPTRQFN
jgi:hypothetical protein